MYQQLEPGGTLMILEREKSGSALTLAWGLLHRHLIKDHVEFYQSNEIVSMLKGSGFDSIKIADTINRYFWRGKLYTSIVLIAATKP